MKKELVNHPGTKLVGLSINTNNHNEMDQTTAKIAPLAAQFWQKNIASQIMHRKTPGITWSVYTNYDSNEHGDYTYFIGEAVSSFDTVPDGMQKLVIPAAKYQKFTTFSGKMPDVVIQAWQQIWNMTPSDLGGERTYQTDFEIYDERAHDLANTSLDIYIGIK